MNRVGNYDVYQNSLYERTKTAKEADGAAQIREAAAGRAEQEKRSSAAKTGQTTESEKSGKVTLSTDAKNLLKELKKKYGNMDFIIADYETDEEAERYLSRGTGEYSVLLTPDELEKMAADEEYKNQNLNILDDAVSKLDEMKTQLGEKGQEVSRIGITIGNEGKVSYFAELEKVNEKQRERIEKKREERREEDSAKAEEKTGRKEPDGSREPVKRTVVRADSVEALLKKIEEVDWSSVRAEEEQAQGRKIDFTA